MGVYKRDKAFTEKLCSASAEICYLCIMHRSLPVLFVFFLSKKGKNIVCNENCL